MVGTFPCFMFKFFCVNVRISFSCTNKITIYQFYLRNKNARIVDILISTGAKFDQDNMEVARELSIAATDNDVERLRLWAKCNVNMNMPDLEGRSPLHVVRVKAKLDAVLCSHIKKPLAFKLRV